MPRNNGDPKTRYYDAKDDSTEVKGEGAEDGDEEEGAYYSSVCSEMIPHSG